MARKSGQGPQRSGIMLFKFALAAVCLTSIRCISADLGCSHLLDEYLQKHHREAKPYTDDNQIVYFLHVPRTAGRTFHSCMLKLGTPPERRCPKAYDHLRLNMTVPKCNLLSSHDDFSVVSMLPDNVAVLTHLRDPVDRFLSAYEFAVEVGSRAVNRPTNFRKRPDKIATEDVWPWSYLVPFFAKDVKERVSNARKVPQPDKGNWIFVKHPDGSEYWYNKVLGYSKWNLTEEEQTRILPPLNPYDNPLVLSLKGFVRHPIAAELLHNGQAFQVLGVTNYSHWGDAGSMRHCFWSDPSTQEHLVQTAVNRVKRFIHVGVTDRLMDSVTAAAVAMKFSLDGPAYGGGDDDAVPQIGGRRGRRPLATQQGGQQQGQAMFADHKDDGGDGAAGGVELQATDLPELAEKVREARSKLQAAQRQLFQANQAGDDEDQIMALKARVGNLRADLRDLQEALLEARSKLPTSTEPETDSKKAAQHAQQAASNTKKLGQPLGVEYQRCANRAQARNLQRRDNSLTALAMPDGRHVSFSKAARKLIPQELLDEIRQLNQADTTLHKLGQQILEQNRAEWKQKDMLQELPQMPPPRPLPSPPLKFPFPKPNEEDPNNTGEL